jgi:cytochrome c oxidase cbb3-type subunit 4
MAMDINDMRVIVMLLGLVLFLAIWAWSWSSRRREAFDEAARLPFADDESGREAHGEQR